MLLFAARLSVSRIFCERECQTALRVLLTLRYDAATEGISSFDTRIISLSNSESIAQGICRLNGYSPSMLGRVYSRGVMEVKYASRTMGDI